MDDELTPVGLDRQPKYPDTKGRDNWRHWVKGRKTQIAEMVKAQNEQNQGNDSIRDLMEKLK